MAASALFSHAPAQIVSFAAPTINSLLWSPFPTASSVAFTINGTNFGPRSNSANVAVFGVTIYATYGPYLVSDCAVAYGVPSSIALMTCNSSIGMGAGHSVTVVVSGQQGTTSQAVSYAFPSITALDCMETGGAVSSLMPTQGCWLRVTGMNFGPLVAGNIVTFSLNGQGSTGAVQIRNCSLTVAHTEVMCWAEPNVGVSFTPRLDIAQRLNVTNPSVRISFRPPVVVNMSGALAMATAGGETITFTGTDFGPAGTPVSATYISTSSPVLTYSPACSVSVPHVEIVCVTTAGVGKDLRWQLVIGLQAVLGSQTTAYIPPAVTAVTPPSAGTMRTVAGEFFTVAGADP
jgi:hypothetical protein